MYRVGTTLAENSCKAAPAPHNPRHNWATEVPEIPERRLMPATARGRASGPKDAKRVLAAGEATRKARALFRATAFS